MIFFPSALALGTVTAALKERTDIKVGVQPQLLDAMARMIPLGRGGTPEEAADAVYLFCSPESNYVSGQVLVCGGGLIL